MKVEYHHLKPSQQFHIANAELGHEADLVLYFASPDILESSDVYHTIKRAYPSAQLLGCSTGGEMTMDDACEGTAVVSAIAFETTKIQCVSAIFESDDDSFNAGARLGAKFEQEGLKAIFLLSDGLNVNGSAIIRGIQSIIGKSIPITGGLAGDGSRFKKTYVGLNQNPTQRNMAAVGFYGDDFHLGYGAYAGGEPFGPFRSITKSKGNVVYEIDNEPALDLYKSYLGKFVDDLPASALFFPMIIASPDAKEDLVVRTVLAVDEGENSLTFAGDMPQGYITRLMLARKDHFLKGAQIAAELVDWDHEPIGHTLAILVSCIGRKLSMSEHVVEEVDVVREHFNKEDSCDYVQMGFFSYGEICPHRLSNVSELHNETMTISLMYETHGQRSNQLPHNGA